MSDISLVNVCRTYKSGYNAVKGFNLDIRGKELIIFVRPSDCGRSTTLRMIAGLEEISSGELRIDNCPTNMMEPKNRGLSMVFQNYALYPHMMVYENMAFGLKVHKAPAAEIQRRIREVAGIPEIDHFLDRRPEAPSGGQKQRVAIGSVIVREPRAYPMGEPLSNLDAKLRPQMWVEIAKLHKRLGATIVYVTHDQVEATTLGTGIVAIKEGVIQQVAPPAELYRNPVNQFVAGSIGSPSMNFLDSQAVVFNKMLWLEGNGWRLQLPSVLGRRLLKGGYAGRNITLGIRAEDLHQEGEGDSFLQMGVQVGEMLGSGVLLHGDAYGRGTIEYISVKLLPSCTAKTEDRIRLYVGMDRIKLSDGGTEKNILCI